MSWSINYNGFPCKDCPDRYPACSAKCERYKAARAKYDELKHAADLKNHSGLYTQDAILKNRDKTARRWLE